MSEKVTDDLIEYIGYLQASLKQLLAMIANDDYDSDDLFPVVTESDAYMETVSGLTYLYFRKLEQRESEANND